MHQHKPMVLSHHELKLENKVFEHVKVPDIRKIINKKQITSNNILLISQPLCHSKNFKSPLRGPKVSFRIGNGDQTLPIPLLNGNTQNSPMLQPNT